LAAIFSLVRVMMHGSQRLEMARAALLDGRQQRQQRAYGPATVTLTRGQALAEGLTGAAELQEEFRTELRLASRAQAAESLHSIADQLRFSIDPALLHPDQLRDLETKCGQIWEQRGSMLQGDSGDLDAALVRRVREDLGDVAVLWTELRTRSASAEDAPEAHQEALRTLQQVRGELGDGMLIDRAIAGHNAA